MNEPTLEKIRAELASILVGQKFGKIFTLSRFRLAIDFRLHDSTYLFISVEPSAPDVYLIKRRLRDLEKLSKNATPFVMSLRKRLANAVLQSVEKLENERVLLFSFLARNELEQTETYTLIIQLTGRSSNIFLLDKSGFIIDAMRENSGEGQEIAGKYAAPAGSKAQIKVEEAFPKGNFDTLSEAVDARAQEIEHERIFQAKSSAALSKLKKEIAKREKLEKNLRTDLENHGDADVWKKFGDLLLANMATARREDDKIFVSDFYDENMPTIEIEVDKNLSITEAAEKFFKRYTKARNAKTEIERRLAILESELELLKRRKMRLDDAVAQKDEDILAEFLDEKPEKSRTKIKEKPAENFKGAKNYISSDGFEILVGKGAKDNDFLTFRVAKSLDLWLHAADYPGSHVVVKNPNRLEIPNNTLREAAQIAAFFSQAKTQAKVAVHYTYKKFVNKPKGSGAGLVSLASFKTILVEPKMIEK